jgi:phosphoglucosamine mutase
MGGNMRQLFGTDGIRGRANVYPMTADLALGLGQAVGHVFRSRLADQDQVVAVIGKDTRKSGYIFEYALASGLCSVGVDVYLVGPMPTPSISHLTKSFAADLGIVISASHNPASDNGIKLFDKAGFKLPDELEEEIEAVLDEGVDTSGINGVHVGSAMRIDDAAGRYIEYTKGAIGNMSLAGIRVVLDCANGAAYKVAPPIFRELGAEVFVLNNDPNGTNINEECGSTYPEVISEAVLKYRADIGIALDGDADRVIMVDENGERVDGDHIIAMCALDMKRRGKLTHDAVVVTVMSNIGFDIAMREQGIRVIRTDVGDRHVVEEMRRNGYALGGEQSGHIIFLKRSTTGDGTLSALHVLAMLKTGGQSLSELAQCMTSYPQVLVNVPVTERRPLEKMPTVQELIAEAAEHLGDDGRILVRYSGTERKCRVMVEGPDLREIDQVAGTIADGIGKEIGS